MNEANRWLRIGSLSILLFAAVFAFCLTPAGLASEKPAARAASGQDGPGAGDATKKDYVRLGFDLMKKETVGDLRLNSTDDTVLGLIGEPEDRSPARIWGADGREHQSWYYPARGLELGMVRAGDGQKVERICLKSPCELKTGRGIGIGSTEEEVRAAYRDEIDLQARGREGWWPAPFMAGSSSLWKTVLCHLFSSVPAQSDKILANPWSRLMLKKESQII
ncbi:MAG: hypothetical protein P4N41_02950 [Negativicutes bacterium]|nr:hypothetical protein [Negativicutes bacterium]